jgi:hypothetical protein
MKSTLAVACPDSPTIGPHEPHSWAAVVDPAATSPDEMITVACRGRPDFNHWPASRDEEEHIRMPWPSTWS